MKSSKSVFLLFILFSLFTSLTVAQEISKVKSSNGIEWQPFTVDEAIEKASERNKDILLYFYSDECEACEDVSETVFTDHELAEAINHYIPLKIDGESSLGEELGSTYDLIAYPSFIFIDSRGDVFGKIIGHIEWSRKDNLLLSLIKDPIAAGK